MKRIKKFECCAVSALMLMMTVFCTGISAAAEPEEILLFFLSESYTEYLTIPDSLNTAYQLPADETYTVSGSVVGVDENGLVTVMGREVYYIGSGMRIDYEEGTAVVTGRTSGTKYQFRVCEYGRYCAERTVNEYIQTNMTEDLTDREKLELACQFVAGYDYSPNFSSMISMVATGVGGDCWASTSAINYICTQLGFRSRTRDASKDPGAGSGHRNNVVETTDGMTYMVDCGYTGSAPRTYSVTPYTVPFRFTIRANETLEITEYFGFDTELVIPAEIDGQRVTSIGAAAIGNANRYLGTPITSVTLPDTLEHIGDSAFWDMKGLTELRIPASVGSIEKAAFSGCDSLHLVIDPANPFYVMQDDILYTKDMTTLVCAVGFNKMTDNGNGGMTYIKRAVTVPDGVKYIEDQAFYKCTSLSEITFPDTLLHIGYRAFGSCSLRKAVVFPASLKGIGYGAFSDSGAPAYVFKGSDYVINDTTENKLNEKESGETLESTTFGTQPIFLIAPNGSAAEQYAADYGTRVFTVIRDGKTEKEESERYRYAEYKDSETLLLAADESSAGNWQLIWNPDTGLALHLSGTDISTLGSDFCNSNAVQMLIVDPTVTHVDDSVLTVLSRLTEICGEPGTYAQQLAFRLGYHFTPNAQQALAGDCNNDGAVDSADCVMLAKWLGCCGTLIKWENADMNGDSVISGVDLSMLRRVILTV